MELDLFGATCSLSSLYALVRVAVSEEVINSTKELHCPFCSPFLFSCAALDLKHSWNNCFFAVVFRSFMLIKVFAASQYVCVRGHDCIPERLTARWKGGRSGVTEEAQLLLLFVRYTRLGFLSRVGFRSRWYQSMMKIRLRSQRIHVELQGVALTHVSRLTYHRVVRSYYL